MPDEASRDWEREQARERHEQRLMSLDEHEWPEIPVLQQITVRPVGLTAPEYAAADRIIWGECPECGGPDKPRHGCPAKE